MNHTDFDTLNVGDTYRYVGGISYFLKTGDHTARFMGGQREFREQLTALVIRIGNTDENQA
jgi:hypothetical protein